MTSDTQDDAQTSQDVIDNKVGTTSVQSRFYASDRCLAARMALQQIVDSPSYSTESSYFDGQGLGFVERHLHYLSTHPTTLVDGYISNLKLMTRIRSDGQKVR